MPPRQPRVSCSFNRRSAGSAHERVEDRRQRAFGLGAHFLVGCILDRMRHENIARFRHAEGVSLEIGGFIKL